MYIYIYMCIYIYKDTRVEFIFGFLERCANRLMIMIHIVLKVTIV